MVKTKERERRIQFVGLIERFDSVLYPFDIAALIDRMPEWGWVVPSRPRDPESITLEKPPSKGSVSLLFNRENKTLGVGGNDLEEALKLFNELRERVVEAFGIPEEVKTDYIELRYIGTLAATRPAHTLSTWWQKSELSNELGGGLAEIMPSLPNVGQGDIRLAPVGLSPNRPLWTEITIRPLNTGSPRYSFDCILRSPEKAVVEGWINSIDRALDWLLDKIEA